MNEKRELYEKFKGKLCLIFYKPNDSSETHRWIGEVVDVTDTHLLERDVWGRLHLLRLDGIIRISTVKKQGES